MKTYILILSLFLVHSCANTALNENQKAAVNDIAVVSFFGDQMPMTFLGKTVFQNEKTDVHVPKWNVNQIFKDALIKETKKSGKRYKEITFDRKKVNAAIKEGNTTKNRLLNQADDEMNDYLLTTAKIKGAKFLWIIRPAAHPYYPEQTGYGLFCRAPAGHAGEWHSYLSFHAALWDVNQAKKIYQGAVNPEIMKTLSGKVCSESKKYNPRLFAEQFKNSIFKMLQKSAGLINEWSGLAPEVPQT